MHANSTVLELSPEEVQELMKILRKLGPGLGNILNQLEKGLTTIGLSSEDNIFGLVIVKDDGVVI